MKRIYILALSLSASLLALGCGGNGASNNDQGVSVTFLGLFSSLPQQGANGCANGGGNLTSGNSGCAQLTNPITGGYISLGITSIGTAPTPLPGFSGLAVDPSGAVHAIVGVQNNMFGQFFRADRVLLEYYVPGASVQPPSTNVAVNFLAGPAESGQAGANGNAGQNGNGTSLRRPAVTSLPPALSQVCNRAFAQVPILPSPIREWLNFNASQLPDAPFDLEIIVKLSGLSSSGNRYETNAGLFTFSVVPDVAVEPAPTAVANGATTTADNGGNTNNLSVSSTETTDASEDDSVGLDELNAAFETESVVEGQ